MMSLAQVLQSRLPNILSVMLLPGFFAVFAYAHWQAYLASREVSLLMICLSEALVSVMYVVRTDPVTVSESPQDWLVAIVGAFAPMLLRPATWGILPEASIAITVGTTLQLLGLISLNRSFALVPARREIKTAWMYRVVRHPIYASYCLIYAGYGLANTSLANVVICATTIGLLGVRVFLEEKHLALDPAYRQYMLKVRYRMVPFVF